MRLSIRGISIFAVVATAVAGCGTTVESTFSTVASSLTASASPSPSAITIPHTPLPSINPDAALTQEIEAAFDPPFTLRIPSDWTAVLRDIQAFQVYSGDEDFEITFDHTYRQHESVDEGIARLSQTSGLVPGRVDDVIVGGRPGKGFVAQSDGGVLFADSGFHTNEASTLEVIVIPVPGRKTITIFLTSGGDPGHGLESLARLARRVFKTVNWH